MCGIVCAFNIKGDKELVRANVLKMAQRVRHRGPDWSGIYSKDGAILVHERLSIVDPISGKQPLYSKNLDKILAVNGEIYNYRELRAELEPLGYFFRSDTDTEVVLCALDHWGVDALIRFNGMFALAFWDRKEKTLLLARDRYGIKPLYYFKSNSTLLFGSEQKAIFAQPSFDRKINKQALLEYFTFQNIFTDQTLTRGINILPAGHYAKLDLFEKSPSLRKTCYWDLKFTEPENPASKEEYLEELDRLFKQAVQRQLVSDVELGAYLSGGMDSGSITAIASKSFEYLKFINSLFTYINLTKINVSIRLNLRNCNSI